MRLSRLSKNGAQAVLGNLIRSSMATDLPSLLSELTEIKAGTSLDDVLTVKRLTAIQDAIRAIAAGDNIYTGQGSGLMKRNGSSWVMLRTIQGAESRLSNIHPFQLLNASEGATKKIRVVFGMVNNSVPTNMKLGDKPPLLLSVSGTGIIYVKVTATSDGGITESVIEQDSEDVPDDDPDTGEFYMTLGTFSADGGNLSLAQNVNGSLFFELCGGAEALWGRL